MEDFSDTEFSKYLELATCSEKCSELNTWQLFSNNQVVALQEVCRLLLGTMSGNTHSVVVLVLLFLFGFSTTPIFVIKLNVFRGVTHLKPSEHCWRCTH